MTRSHGVGDSGVDKPRPNPESIEEHALRLYNLGFNIVPVGVDKKPLCSWSSERKIPLEVLRKKIKNATGVAVIGGVENPFKPVSVLAIIDIDDPGIIEKSPLLKNLLGKTVAWKTGVRCPDCREKHVEVVEPGVRFKCSKCGREFTIREAERGIGALVYLPADEAEKYLKNTLRLGPVEILVKNYQLLPPSIHPSGVFYEYFKPLDPSKPNHGIYFLTDTELENLLEELKTLSKTVDNKPSLIENPGFFGKEEKTLSTRIGGGKALRELSDSEIIEIKELLKNIYKPGFRQHVWLFLSGWAVKAGISPVSIAKALKMLYDETGDTDSLKIRASALVYTYGKAGVSLASYSAMLEKILGGTPYGIDKSFQEGEALKGRTGLQEILEFFYPEEKALEIISRLEEIFGASSPYRDSVVEIIDYEKQIYVVANLRKLVTLRAVRKGDGLVNKDKVIEGAPTQLTVYINPIGGVTKYQVVWETTTRPRPLVIGPAYLDEIVERLKIEGLVKQGKLAYDVVSTVFEGFLRKKKAVIVEHTDATGFMYIDGKLLNANISIEPVSTDELRNALEVLNELASWYEHVIDKFATVVKWAVIAPFSFAYKQKGRWVKWLYLYGASKTGKSTLGEIVLSMWGLDTRHVKTGASIDTPARIGSVLSQSTFPILINEPAGALMKEEIVEILKNAVTDKTARSKYSRGSYVDIPALAPLLFTSNKHLPRDDALLRRLIPVCFTFSNIPSEERIKEFESKVKPKIAMLKSLGSWIANYILEHDLEDIDPLKYAGEVLKQAYVEAGLTPPSWIDAEVETDAEAGFYDDVKEAVRVYLVKKINEEYARFVGKLVIEHIEGSYNDTVSVDKANVPFPQRVKIVLENKLIPFLILKNEEVIATTELSRQLEEVTGNIGGLRGLAELLGWDYRVVKIGGKTHRVAVIELNKLIEFLEAETEPA